MIRAAISSLVLSLTLSVCVAPAPAFASIDGVIESDYNLSDTVVDTVDRPHSEVVRFSYEDAVKAIKRDRRKRILPLELTWLALHAVDWYQTDKCSRMGRTRCKEVGGARKFIGSHPNRGEVALFFLVSGALHYIVAMKTAEQSPTAALVFEGVTIVPKGRTVIANWKIGLHP